MNPDSTSNTANSSHSSTEDEGVSTGRDVDGEDPSDPVEGQDGADVGEVVFENESVRVIEVSLEPAEATPKHWAGPRMVYSLSDYTLRWTEGDAEPVERSWKAGEAHWHVAAEHIAENAGEGPAHYLVISFSS